MNRSNKLFNNKGIFYICQKMRLFKHYLLTILNYIYKWIVKLGSDQISEIRMTETNELYHFYLKIDQGSKRPSIRNSKDKMIG